MRARHDRLEDDRVRPADPRRRGGDGDGFVAKYDASGTKRWTQPFGTVYYDYAVGVATDDADNVYVTGSVSGSLDGNAWVGFDDVFLTKSDAAGMKQWARQFGANKGFVAVPSDDMPILAGTS